MYGHGKAPHRATLYAGSASMPRPWIPFGLTSEAWEKRGHIYRTGSLTQGTNEAHRFPRCSARYRCSPSEPQRTRDARCRTPTGSSGVVTHPRLPQNVACRFAALRSSGVGSQHCECLQRLVGQPQLRSQQALCYSFESCFHGRCSIPLNRWPPLPLHGGHVAFEQLNTRWPLPHVVGSPNLGVLSASLTAAGSLDRSRLLGLAGPTSLRLNPTALPCSHGTL